MNGELNQFTVFQNEWWTWLDQLLTVFLFRHGADQDSKKTLFELLSCLSDFLPICSCWTRTWVVWAIWVSLLTSRWHRMKMLEIGILSKLKMDSSGLLLFTSDHCHRWKFSFKTSAPWVNANSNYRKQYRPDRRNIQAAEGASYLLGVHYKDADYERTPTGRRPVSFKIILYSCGKSLSGSPFGVEFCSRVKVPIIPMTTIQYRFRFIINSFSANSNVISSYVTDFYVIHSSSKGQWRRQGHSVDPNMLSAMMN